MSDCVHFNVSMSNPRPQLKRWLDRFDELWNIYRATTSATAEPPLYKDVVIKPLADFLNKHCFQGKAKVEIYGPQGICARHSIYFTHRGRDYALGLEPTMGDGARMMVIRRYDLKPTTDHPARSIGEANGMNYPTTEVLQCHPADWWRSKMNSAEAIQPETETDQ